ncbi:PREDICTED: uncharacterized protein LOC109115746 [Nelumbo nucifera]|uniref:Uncharacterized protein LOC109115746 n=1 Tax=Nelumbo nucifera TaxID=4432 RepID=A0A1U8QAP1_NELNU|nr:PREDICTED: uncharacterized protein LOC109115746 [Nelumbo nucifera]
MTTRSKASRSAQALTATRHPLPLALFYDATTQEEEPSSYKQAAKSPHWCSAIAAEFYALLQNDTWELVTYDSFMNVVGSKWVFKIKRHPDGSIECYEAYLVMQGFTQVPGVDFIETFSPVVKSATVHTVLSLAVSCGWDIC